MVDPAAARDQLDHALTGADFPGLGPAQPRGACDLFDLGEYHLLINSDRVCRGDATLGTVPFKGEVSLRIATWWIDVIGDLLPSPIEHIIDPQALLIRPVEALPVRLAVHGFLSGRLWRAYEAGLRQYDGVDLADGLVRDQRLAAPLALALPADGDLASVEPVEIEKLYSGGAIDQETFAGAKNLALRVYARGQELADARGVILVDTVYRFGPVAGGSLAAVDLVHAPSVTTYRSKDSPHDVAAHLSEHEIIDAWPEARDDADALPTELRLRLAEAYVRLGECFIADFEPYLGPVANRLALSLSVVGLMA